MRSISALILVMVVVMQTATAEAQQDIRADAPPSRSLEDVLAQARPGQRLMIAQTPGGRLDGTVFSRGDGTLGLLSNGTERFVAFNAIDSVWTRSTAPRTTLLVGALVGGVVFSYLVGGMSNAYEKELRSGAGGYMAGFALGLIPGAIAGGVVASGMPRWTLRFP